MPQVKGTVRVRWPIVQNVGWQTFAGFLNPFVDPLLFPTSQDFRLILRQIGLHGEVRFGKVDGRFQVERHALNVS